jgi:hypothetical protein
MGLSPIVSPLAVRTDKMGAMPVGPGAAAADGEGENEDELRVGGVMDLRIKNALRLSNSDVGAAQTIAGTRYEQTIVSFHKTVFRGMVTL